MNAESPTSRVIARVRIGLGCGLLTLGLTLGADAQESAPSFMPGVQVGTVGDGEISEASGLAATRTRPGALWVHNDSGHKSRVFALNLDGSTLGTWDLEGVRAKDPEDIAVGPGPEPGVHFVYLADIGDNLERRAFIVIYRFAEPDTTKGGGTVASSGISALEFTYPDGAHDAEALMSDPLSGDLYIITKKVTGKSAVYRAPFPHSAGKRTRLEKTASIAFEGSGASDLAITGADISRTGNEILIRTYNKAAIRLRTPGESIAAALGKQAYPVPVPGPPAEPQGESIAYSDDGAAYYTLGEGIAQPLFRFDRNKPD